MINYKLLTPGPLTTSETVKKEMMVDHCTWVWPMYLRRTTLPS